MYRKWTIELIKDLQRITFLSAKCLTWLDGNETFYDLQSHKGHPMYYFKQNLDISFKVKAFKLKRRLSHYQMPSYLLKSCIERSFQHILKVVCKKMWRGCIACDSKHIKASSPTTKYDRIKYSYDLKFKFTLMFFAAVVHASKHRI